MIEECHRCEGSHVFYFGVIFRSGCTHYKELGRSLGMTDIVKLFFTCHIQDVVNCGRSVIISHLVETTTEINNVKIFSPKCIRKKDNEWYNMVLIANLEGNLLSDVNQEDVCTNTLFYQRRTFCDTALIAAHCVWYTNNTNDFRNMESIRNEKLLW